VPKSFSRSSDRASRLTSSPRTSFPYNSLRSETQSHDDIQHLEQAPGVPAGRAAAIPDSCVSPVGGHAQGKQFGVSGRTEDDDGLGRRLVAALMRAAVYRR
jgi:hypothetical protein